jgi:hypothetical protein
VNLIPTPTVVLSDADVACALHRAIAVIDPLLTLLASDPVGLKARGHDLDADSAVGRALDAAAWVLDAADVPGTKSWQDMSVDQRADWWVHRVGALDTVVVAFPGALGVLADRLPVQDLIGFASQAVVLVAVAREHGVTDRDQQVRLLASVLCDRDLDAAAASRGADGLSGSSGHGAGTPDDHGAATPAVDDVVTPPGEDTDDGAATGLPRALWRVAGLLRAISDELVKRSQPRSVYRYLGLLPAVGAVVDYVGEYGALKRAAKEGKRWLAHHAAA